MILKKNEKKQMRGWSLGRYFLVLIALHMNFIDPQTNKILLIIWGQTTSQEMLKFLIVGPKIFWPQLPV